MRLRSSMWLAFKLETMVDQALGIHKKMTRPLTRFFARSVALVAEFCTMPVAGSRSQPRYMDSKWRMASTVGGGSLSPLSQLHHSGGAARHASPPPGGFGNCIKLGAVLLHQPCICVIHAALMKDFAACHCGEALLLCVNRGMHSLRANTKILEGLTAAKTRLI